MLNFSPRGAQLPLFLASAGVGLMIAGCGGGSGTNLPTPGGTGGGLGTAGGTTTGGTTTGGTTTGGGGGFVLGANSIVFVSTRDGNPEIYSLDLNGTTGPIATNARRLTNNDAIDEQPSRSPNGRRVVFSSKRDGNSEIYIINADGSGTPQRLTSDTGPADEAPQDVNPVFSPDNNNILWQSTRGGVRRLYIMDATGANQRPVTLADPAAPTFDGSWNPDGQRLLGFVINTDGTGPNDLALITPAPSATTAASVQILKTGTKAGHPRYSPNGQRIAYFNYLDAQDQARIQLLNSTGTLVSNGPSGGFNQLKPSFSPDSNRLVWEASPSAGEPRQLYVANLAATGEQAAGVAITDNTQGENYDASWTQ